MSESTPNIDAELRKIVEGFNLKYITSQKNDTIILVPSKFSLFWKGFQLNYDCGFIEGVHYTIYSKKELLKKYKEIEQDISDPKKAKERFNSAIKDHNYDLIDYIKDKVNIKNLTDEDTMKKLIKMVIDPYRIDKDLFQTIGFLLYAGVPFTIEDQKLLDDLSNSNSYVKKRIVEINNIVRSAKKIPNAPPPPMPNTEVVDRKKISDQTKPTDAGDRKNLEPNPNNVVADSAKAEPRVGEAFTPMLKAQEKTKQADNPKEQPNVEKLCQKSESSFALPI